MSGFLKMFVIYLIQNKSIYYLNTLLTMIFSSRWCRKGPVEKLRTWWDSELSQDLDIPGYLLKFRSRLDNGRVAVAGWLGRQV